MDLQNKKVLVVGTGISGIGAYELLKQVGAYPVLFDGNENLNIEELKAKHPQIKDAEVVLQTVPEELMAEIVLAVFSPGVPTDTPFADMFRNKKIPVWGEIELAYTYAKGEVVAITGTNGKTTTTTLVGEIMNAYYDSVFVVGNIGNPYTLEALKNHRVVCYCG